MIIKKVRLSLRSYLTLGMLLILVLPISILGTFSYINNRNFLKSQALRYSQSVLWRTTQLLELSLEQGTHIAVTIIGNNKTLELIQSSDSWTFSEKEIIRNQLYVDVFNSDLFESVLLISQSGEYYRLGQWSSATMEYIIAYSKASQAKISDPSNTEALFLTGINNNFETLYLARTLYHPETGIRIGFLVLGVSESYLAKLYSTNSVFENQQTFLMNSNQLIFSHNVKSKRGVQWPYSQILLNTLKSKGWIEFEDTLFIHSSLSVGWDLILMIPNESLLKDLHSIIMITAVIYFCIIGLAILSSVFFSKLFTTPIVHLEHLMELATRGDLSVRSTIPRNKDLASLAKNFNYMISQIQNLETHLKNEIIQKEEYQEKLKRVNLELEERVVQRTKELEESYIKLQNTKEKLVEAEKLASMGEVIAGIAHEMNTPIGVGITTVSFIQNMLQRRKGEINTISDDNEKNLFLQLSNSLELIETSLNKASEIVKNFKMLSPKIIHKGYIKDNYYNFLSYFIQTKKKQSRNKNISISLHCESDLIAYYDPDLMEFIFHHLFTNSVIHGFNEGGGEIEISAYKLNEELIINFKDNGKGVSRELSSKVFHPFVTSRRGKGSTGLGLHLVYTIVVNKLNGFIELQKPESQGTSIIIRLPQSGLNQ
jgi:signal transduction histidine kinase